MFSKGARIEESEEKCKRYKQIQVHKTNLTTESTGGFSPASMSSTLYNSLSRFATTLPPGPDPTTMKSNSNSGNRVSGSDKHVF
jgi:hypothetical protein